MAARYLQPSFGPPAPPPPPPEVAGVGVFLSQGDVAGAVPYVDYLLPGGAAEASGRVLPGDIIVAVDGVGAGGAQVEQLRQSIVGPSGTFVELSLERPGVGVFTVSLQRGVPETQSEHRDRPPTWNRAPPPSHAELDVWRRKNAQLADSFQNPTGSSMPTPRFGRAGAPDLVGNAQGAAQDIQHAPVSNQTQAAHTQNGDTETPESVLRDLARLDCLAVPHLVARLEGLVQSLTQSSEETEESDLMGGALEDIARRSLAAIPQIVPQLITLTENSRPTTAREATFALALTALENKGRTLLLKLNQFVPRMAALTSCGDVETRRYAMLCLAAFTLSASTHNLVKNQPGLLQVILGELESSSDEATGRHATCIVANLCQPPDGAALYQQNTHIVEALANRAAWPGDVETRRYAVVALTRLAESGGTARDTVQNNQTLSSSLQTLAQTTRMQEAVSRLEKILGQPRQVPSQYHTIHETPPAPQGNPGEVEEAMRSMPRPQRDSLTNALRTLHQDTAVHKSLQWLHVGAKWAGVVDWEDGGPQSSHPLAFTIAKTDGPRFVAVMHYFVRGSTLASLTLSASTRTTAGANVVIRDAETHLEGAVDARGFRINGTATHTQGATQKRGTFLLVFTVGRD